MYIEAGFEADYHQLHPTKSRIKQFKVDTKIDGSGGSELVLRVPIRCGGEPTDTANVVLYNDEALKYIYSTDKERKAMIEDFIWMQRKNTDSHRISWKKVIHNFIMENYKPEAD